MKKTHRIEERYYLPGGKVIHKIWYWGKDKNKRAGVRKRYDKREILVDTVPLKT